MDEAIWVIVKEYAGARARIWKTFRREEQWAQGECDAAKDQAWEEYKHAIAPIQVAYDNAMSAAKALRELEEVQE